MTNLQSALLFIAVPLVAGCLFCKGDRLRFVICFLLGELVCQGAMWLNDFVVVVTAMDATDALVKIAPIVDETIKATPLVFYAILCNPKHDRLLKSAVAVSVGFAALENFYLTKQSSADLIELLGVAASSGLMHLLCGALLGAGFCFIDRHRQLSWYGLFASVCLCITYHAIYSLLTSAPGLWQVIGYAMPFLLAMITLIAWQRYAIVRLQAQR